jgi:hypothetical protein
MRSCADEALVSKSVRNTFNLLIHNSTSVFNFEQILLTGFSQIFVLVVLGFFFDLGFDSFTGCVSVRLHSTPCVPILLTASPTRPEKTSKC